MSMSLPGHLVVCPVCDGHGCLFCGGEGHVTETRAGQWSDDATPDDYRAMFSETPASSDLNTMLHDLAAELDATLTAVRRALED